MHTYLLGSGGLARSARESLEWKDCHGGGVVRADLAVEDAPACIGVYVCVHVDAYMRMCTRRPRRRGRTCMHRRVCVCACGCMCMHVCMDAHACVCMCMHACARIYVRVHTHTHAYAYACMHRGRTCIRVHMHTRGLTRKRRGAPSRLTY